MTTENRISRWAGALYLVVVVTGLFSLAYVPSRIQVPHNSHATIDHIVASESLFRLGIAASIVMQVAFLLLPLVLYRLLRPVHPAAGVLMVALATVSVPIGLVSLGQRLDALSLTDPALRQAFTPEQLRAAVQLSLEAYRNGLHVTSLFWGLWLLPFGYLVFRSGFLPRILGILLMLGCAGYMVEVFGHLLVPGYADMVVSKYAGMPAAVGEIGTCLWLLLVGARRPKGSA